MSKSLYDFSFPTLDGREQSFADFRSDVLLIVNVASRCSFTPQYKTLAWLDERYRDQGLRILGFPSNDFLGQEPDSPEEIQEFCTREYGVRFELFAKSSVRGEAINPIYRYLTEQAPRVVSRPDGKLEKFLSSLGQGRSSSQDVLWNFEKFLIGREGHIAGRYAPDVSPDDPILIQAIEKELRQPGFGPSEAEPKVQLSNAESYRREILL